MRFSESALGVDVGVLEWRCEKKWGENRNWYVVHGQRFSRCCVEVVARKFSKALVGWSKWWLFDLVLYELLSSGPRKRVKT
jgi:hypothetical protein